MGTWWTQRTFRCVEDTLGTRQMQGFKATSVTAARAGITGIQMIATPKDPFVAQKGPEEHVTKAAQSKRPAAQGLPAWIEGPCVWRAPEISAAKLNSLPTNQPGSRPSSQGRCKIQPQTAAQLPGGTEGPPASGCTPRES